MEQTFEQKLELVGEILKSLEDENISLQKSVELYKDGARLIREAKNMLEAAKLDVEQVGLEEQQ